MRLASGSTTTTRPSTPSTPARSWRPLVTCPQGTYVAIWRAVGLDDGHTVIGKFSFSVGAAYDDSAVAAVAGDLGHRRRRARGRRGAAGGPGRRPAGGRSPGCLVVAPARTARPVVARDRVRRPPAGDLGARVWRSSRPCCSCPPRRGCAAAGAEGFGAALVGALGGTVGLSVAVRLAAFTPFAIPCARPRRCWCSTSGPWDWPGFVVEGHSISEEPFLVVALADMVHLAAGAVWLGGLAALAVVLRGPRTAPTRGRRRRRDLVLDRGGRRRGGRRGRRRGPGGRPAWAVSRQPPGTTYGVLVLAKVAVVAVVVGIGGYNRFALVPRIRDGVRPMPEGAAATMAGAGGAAHRIRGD